MQPETAPRTIIVGYDGREESADALALAQTLAGPLGAKLVLAAVYRTGRSLADESAYVAAARAEAEAKLAAADLGEGADAERIAVSAGSPAHGLHDLARVREAALVVVGASRHGGLGRVLPGSVANRLLHGCPCAVAVAPRGYAADPHRMRVIEVAYDESEESEAAVRAATEIAIAEGGTLRIVAVVDPVEYGFGPVVGSYAVTYADDLSEHLHARTRELAESLPSAVRADALVERGNVCAHLIAESEKGVDLLVMGSRGYGPVGSVLLGSVSSRVLDSAQCPVLVLPRGAHMPGSPADPREAAAAL